MSLRTQAALLSALLLLAPLLAWLDVERFEKLLIDQQEGAVRTTARHIAKDLSQDEVLGRLGTVDGNRAALYAYELSSPTALDGRDDDWTPWQSLAKRYGVDDTIEVHRPYSEDSLHFYLLAGRDAERMRLFLRVVDDRIVYRAPGSLSVHRNDHVQLSLIDRRGDFRRYTIAAVQPGPATAFLVAPIAEGSRAIRPEDRIEAMWLATESGYNLELSVPLAFVTDRLSVSVADVDDVDERTLRSVIGTASTFYAEDIGHIILPSPDIEARLREAGIPHSRLRVIDARGRLVASVGDISQAPGFWQNEPDPSSPFFRFLLAPLAQRVPESIADRAPDPARIEAEHIARALAGDSEVASLIRASSDGRATIVSAAAPVTINGETRGVVLMDENTNGVIALRNDFMAMRMGYALIFMVLAIILLMTFAWVTARRLRHFSHRLRHMADAQGRIRGTLDTSAVNDEVGELTREIAAMSVRVRQYNQYLEDMSHRLAHELRTPITVIRSSLDNLSLQARHDDTKVYLDRAHEGVQRLSTILTNMTEATRLEESLNADELEYFDIDDVVRGCVQGYEVAYPDHTFELSIEGQFERLYGLPELIAQMMDKLIGNAVEFAAAGTPIKVRLTDEQDIVLRVLNNGPRLPAGIEDRLFDSMISIRRDDKGEGSHLGLGLYIARIIAEFHGGSISAHDREDTEGVVVTVRLPPRIAPAR